MQGSCLCGAIRFTVNAAPQGVSCCHCRQCRKQSGHVWASAYVSVEDLAIKGEPKWFKSSEKGQRGFCGACGSFLFWRHNDDDHISFSMGSLDEPTGLRLEKHIFTASKGDYYDIADGKPQS